MSGAICGKCMAASDPGKPQPKCGRDDCPGRQPAPFGKPVQRTHFEKDGCDPPQWHGPTGE